MIHEGDLLVRRMLVALDATSQGLAGLDAAAGLAGADAELVGLFVEDAALFRLATHSAVRFVTLASPSPRSHDVATMESAVRARSVRAEAALRTTASRARLRFSFRVVRGEVDAEIARASEGVDVVVLPMGDSSARTARHVADQATVVLFRKGQTLHSPTVVYDGTPPSQRALAAAAHVALHDGGRVTVLASTKPAGDDATARLAARGVESTVRGPEALPVVVRTQGGALIIAAEGLPAGEAFDDLVATARRPIIIVR